MIQKELDSEYLLRKPYDLENQTYDLSTKTYIRSDTGSIGTHIVSKAEEGRIDLVSRRIYQDTNSDHYLMKVNHLYNPFRIKAGDVLMYTSKREIQNTIAKDEDITDIRASLIDANKATRYDPRRIAYNNSVNISSGKYEALPPSIKGDVTPQAVIRGDTVHITPNLVRETFKPNKPEIATPVNREVLDSAASSGGDVQNDTYVFIPVIKQPVISSSGEDKKTESIAGATRAVAKPTEVEVNVNLQISKSLNSLKGK